MTNNIVVFDLETTGLDRSKHHIIQFAALKIDMSTYKIIDDINLYIQPDGDYVIDIAAYFKHHINAEFLKDKPHLIEVADQIIDFIGDCDVVTYNGNSFDIPFLIASLKKVGKTISFMNRKCYDAFIEERKRNGINLENTYKRYKHKTMEEAGLTAHDAFSDIKATFAVFIAQQRQEAYEPEQMFGEDGVIKIVNFNGEDLPCFTLGKYRGVSLEYVKKIDIGYLQWAISDKCNFIQSTKDYISNYINN